MITTINFPNRWQSSSIAARARRERIESVREFNFLCTLSSVAALLLLLATASASATVRYVDANSTSPTPPYTNWATAARIIQDAVDAAAPGDTVLVTNGVYALGGRDVSVLDTNQQPPVMVSRGPSRVVITNSIRLESVNGPAVTTIVGRTTLTNEIGEVIGFEGGRGAYLGNDSILSGFTLTKGVSYRGAGVFCENSGVVTNCVITGNSGVFGGGAYGGTLYNCTLIGNSVDGFRGSSGGGAYGSTLYNCTLTGNSADNGGGGAAHSTLNYCTLTSNSAYDGGGAAHSTLYNSDVTDNFASFGGGVIESTLNNCRLTGNSAVAGDGGGTWGGTLYNCALSGNSADEGGGAYYSTLYNCALTENSAYEGGGASRSTLYNSILYFNAAPYGANYLQTEWDTINFCCTAPLPANGVGNITLDPQLASASHLSIFSPCRGAGSTVYTSGADLDGEAWADPPSIGCDEYHAGAVTGPLSVGITAAYTNVAVGYSVGLAARIVGRTTLSIWDFGDGMRELNQPNPMHIWTTPGEYLVSLWAFNDSHPQGVSATVAVHVELSPVHYVAADSSNPVPPYASWATAATNIQDAIDAAVAGGEVVVSNGVYATGGRAVVGTMTNRVAVTKPLTVRSVNGPQFTVIRGYPVPDELGGWRGMGEGAIRCVYLVNGARLNGFTLTNGFTQGWVETYEHSARSGGGLWCGSASVVVSNCVVAGNSAYSYGGGSYGGALYNCRLSGNSAYESGGGAYRAVLYNCLATNNSAAGDGGGAYSGTLYNCTLTGNSATYGGGGGAFEGTLYNCTLKANSADDGGGTWGGTLNNCTLTGNSAKSAGGGAVGGTLNNCTLTANSAYAGGGAVSSTLSNCIVYFNAATNGANFDTWSVLKYCCTTPMPTNGVGNITNAPLFVNQAGGNLRLQSNSPCINAGLNAHVPGSTDLDSLPRIVGGTVDIGAYEFQGPGSVISYAWLQHYGLPTDGSADTTDPDADDHNNWQEWRCGTSPINALSVLHLLSASRADTNVIVSWQSVAGVNYFLERSTNLGASPRFILLAPNISGQPGSTTYTDTNAAPLAPLFYRVGVGP